MKYVFVSQKTEAIDCVKYTAYSVVVSNSLNLNYRLYSYIGYHVKSSKGYNQSTCNPPPIFKYEMGKIFL